MPGSPEIVVQDRFADASPTKRIVSPAGTHELYVYDDRYEVYEIATGARIVNRPGINPSFSPAGRFVAATESLSAGFDIVDLVTQEEVKPTTGELRAALVWLRNDSYVIEGGSHTSTFSVRNIIDDNGEAADTGYASCSLCKPWDIQLVLI